MSRRGLGWLGAGTALALALRVPFDLRPLYSLDESVFALGARAILEGGLVYRDVWDHRGPLLHYVYAGVFALAGLNDTVAVHLLTTAALAVQAVLLYRLAAAWLSPAAGAWAALFFAFFSTFGARAGDALAANAEIWTNLFVLVGLVVLARALRDHAARLYALAGACLGLAVLTKQVAVFLVPLLMLAPALGPAWGLGERRLAPGPAMVRGLLAGIGVAAPLAAVAGYYAARGAFEDFARLFVGYNVHYLEAFYASGAPAAAGDLLGRAGRGLARSLIVPFSPRYTFLVYALASLAVAARVLGGRRWPARALGPAPASLWFVCAWLALAAVPTVLLGRAFQHYFILLLPPVCVLAAWVFARAVQGGDVRSPSGLLVAVLLGAVLLQAVHRQGFEVFGPAEPGAAPDPFEQVVAEVRTRTRPDERIFVWGRTDVYVRADRRPAGRFVFMTFLTGWTPGGVRPADPHGPGFARARALWLDDLRRYRPRLIVDGHRAEWWTDGYPLEGYPDVWRLIEADYRRVRELPPYVVYERVAP